MKKGTKTFTLIIFFVALIALGSYFYVTNKADNTPDVTITSEKDILLNYDMAGNYPKTVRETVKMHCRYLKYIYNEGLAKDFTEDDLFVMNQKMRQLYDDELLEINQADQQLKALNKEMEVYKAKKQKIVSYTLAEASQIEYNMMHANQRLLRCISNRLRLCHANQQCSYQPRTVCYGNGIYIIKA